MPKFKILEPTSTDAGTYGGMRDVEWEAQVDAEYINEKQNSIYVSGEEFIRIGGCPKAFNPKHKYMWGTFEEVLD
ncbi:hypothetical protein [Vibrio phage RYC]|nr:hypothetical protein [Vibrio phage RYC]